MSTPPDGRSPQRRGAFREDAGVTDGARHVQDPDRVSKSQRKREMLALQDLGKELVALGPNQLAQLDLPASLLEAVRVAQRISAFGARRRQLQYIGRLMREVEAAPIRARLDAWKGASAKRNARPPRGRRDD